MTEQDLEARLRAAQRTEADNADPGALHERVHSIPERVEPQRRHWWSGFRDGAERGTGSGGGSSSRRQNHMILATSVVGVGVLALGGIFAISGVVDPADTSAPGAEQAIVADPVAWSGGIRPGLCPEEPTIEVVGAATATRGGYCTPTTLGMTDERLKGHVRWSSSVDDYVADGFSIGYSGVTIENSGGLWRLVPRLDVSVGSDGEESPWLFVGEGGYDGLLAVAVAQPDGRFGGVDLRGFIVEAELPPAPDIALAE